MILLSTSDLFVIHSPLAIIYSPVVTFDHIKLHLPRATGVGTGIYFSKVTLGYEATLLGNIIHTGTSKVVLKRLSNINQVMIV